MTPRRYLRRGILTVWLGLAVVGITNLLVGITPAARAVTIPNTTTSYYVEHLSAAATDWYDLGCSQGTIDANRAGAQFRIVALDFGEPALSGSTYGVIGFDGAFHDRDDLAPAAEQFGMGYYVCTGTDTASTLIIALVESNEGSQVRDNATQQGRAWSNFVDQVIRAQSVSESQVMYAGGYDMEVGWNSGSDSIAMLNGFYSLHGYDTYDIGDAAGCPTSGRSDCVSDYTWTVEQRYNAAWGFTPAYSLPEIYNTSGTQAQQWANLSRYGAHEHPGEYGAVQFSGVLTQSQACAQRDGCSGTNNTPAQGYTQLYNALAQESDTAMTPRWSDDMKWQN